MLGVTLKGGLRPAFRLCLGLLPVRQGRGAPRLQVPDGDKVAALQLLKRGLSPLILRPVKPMHLELHRVVAPLPEAELTVVGVLRLQVAAQRAGLHARVSILRICAVAETPSARLTAATGHFCSTTGHTGLPLVGV